MMHEEGRGVEKDTQKAIACYERAAADGSADALCTLGVMFERGEHGPADDVKAVEYYAKAAAMGSPIAMCNLVRKHVRGLIAMTLCYFDAGDDVRGWGRRAQRRH